MTKEHRKILSPEHIEKIKDATYAGKNILIIGGVNSGKSTLLREIAETIPNNIIHLHNYEEYKIKKGNVQHLVYIEENAKGIMQNISRMGGETYTLIEELPHTSEAFQNSLGTFMGINGYCIAVTHGNLESHYIGRDLPIDIIIEVKDYKIERMVEQNG